MLVLTRKVGESIVIDGQTYIKVLSVHGEGVRLGIEAPRHISIHRPEAEVRHLDGLVSCGTGLSVDAHNPPEEF